MLNVAGPLAKSHPVLRREPEARLWEITPGKRRPRKSHEREVDSYTDPKRIEKLRLRSPYRNSTGRHGRRGHRDLSVSDPQSEGIAAIRPTGRIRKRIEAAILPIVRNWYRARCDTFGISPSRIEEQR